jgi:Phage endonuclease I
MARKTLLSSKPRTSPVRSRALAAGYRSGLEDRVADELRASGVKAEYEPCKLVYVEPSKVRTYTPDFILPNGIIIETKGRFVTADRQKHKHIKTLHPALDVRFVFSNPNARIGKTSSTTYGMWAEAYGFLFASKSVPSEWLAEPIIQARLEAIQKARK